MRIIGHIEHSTLKITVFKMDNKLSLKFESGLYEQTYKFRTVDGLENFEDIKKLVDEGFIQGVWQEFSRLHRLKMQALSRYLPQVRENEFEEII